jgi:hypothetical protein
MGAENKNVKWTFLLEKSTEINYFWMQNGECWSKEHFRSFKFCRGNPNSWRQNPKFSEKIDFHKIAYTFPNATHFYNKQITHITFSSKTSPFGLDHFELYDYFWPKKGQIYKMTSKNVKT